MSSFRDRIQHLERLKYSLQYHPAERNGRGYLCGCLRTFRMGSDTKIPGRGYKRLEYLRRSKYRNKAIYP